MRILVSLRRAGVAAALLAASPMYSGCDNTEPTDQPAVRFSVEIVAPSVDASIFPAQLVAIEAAATAAQGIPGLGAVTYDWSFGDGEAQIGGGAATEHAWDEPGTYVISVTAVERDGDAIVGQASADLQITVLPAPDLAVSTPSLTLTTATVTSADPIRVSVDVVNRAADAPVPFEVAIYAVPASAFDASAPTAESVATLVTAGSAAALATESFESLVGGNQVNIDLSDLTMPDALGSGEYRVLVFADSGSALSESSETNNFSLSTEAFEFVNTSTDGPDLIVRDVVARPLRANSLTSVTFDATFVNAGSDPALLFEYALYVSAGDAILDDADVRIGAGTIENVTPGTPVTLERVQVSLATPITELGEYYVIVEADSAEDVDETNEANNTSASPRVVITDEPVPGADITVDLFEILPSTTYVRGSVEVNATVSNLGTDDINTQFFCRVYLSSDESLDTTSTGDQVLGTLQVQPLDGGASADVTRVSVVPPIFAPGTWYPFLYCDPSFSVAESDEDNNVLAAGRPLEIAAEAAIDLRAANLVLEPATVANEGSTTVSVDICNDGSNGSTPSVVRVHMSPDPLVDAADPILLQSSVPPIDPGACITIRADATAVCQTFISSYSVYAVADATQTVPEQDETNNVLNYPDPFVVEGLICDCELDAYEPNDSLSRAVYLNPGIPLFEDLTMCVVAVDWYRIPLLRGESLRIAIEFENDRGNLDVTLYGTDRSSELSTSASNGDREEVVFLVAPQSGDYYLKVYGRTEDDRNVYDMELSLSPRESGTDLTPVDVRISNLTPVLGETVDVTFDTVNLGDTAAGSHLARVYLSADADIDPASDALIAETTIASVVDRTRTTVSATLPLEDEGGERYIGVRIDPRNDVAELNENNNDSFSPVFNLDANCFDALEPNNSLDDARLLELLTAPPVSFAGLLACSENADVYEICVGDGDYLDVRAVFDTAQGDIDMKLYDETGAELDRSEGITGEERVGVDYAIGERCFRAEVFVVGRGRQVDYELVVDTGAASEDLACSRLEEPNDNFAGAVQLPLFFDADIAVCPVEDEDYYRVQLAAGTDLTVVLEPATGDADVPAQLRVALFSPSRAFLASTVTATETLRYRVAVSGTHYIRVRSNGAGPRSQDYRIVVGGIAGVDLLPTDLLLEPEVAGPGDTVRFTYTLANARDEESGAAHYAVYLSEDAIVDEGDTLLRELDLGPLAGLTERIEGRRFDVPATLTLGGTYRVILVVDNLNEVVEFVERNNTAFADLIVSPRCVPDLAEPNNFSFEAFGANDALGEALTLCEGDVDWYEYTATSTGSVTVSIDFEHAAGDLDLYVYASPTNPPIGFSDSIGDGESVTFSATSGTTYRFYVESFYGDTNSYTLSLD